MNSQAGGAGARACWFVGAAYGGTEDQTRSFLQEDTWQNEHQHKYLDAVKSIQVGDHIAIKSSYSRKHDLPFDNRGQTVSVMAIKAIGTVTENLGDGVNLKVDWKPFGPPREWYFYTKPSCWVLCFRTPRHENMGIFTARNSTSSSDAFRHGDTPRRHATAASLPRRRPPTPPATRHSPPGKASPRSGARKLPRRLPAASTKSIPQSPRLEGPHHHTGQLVANPRLLRRGRAGLPRGKLQYFRESALG